MKGMIETSKVKGRFTLRHFDVNGKLLNEFTKDNLIVDTGIAYFASRNAGNSIAAVSHMGLGSSPTAPTTGDTTLITEVARASTSNSVNTTVIANDTAVFAAVFGAGAGTGALNEAGLFNAGVAGMMVSRLTFPTVNKGENDSVSITWSLRSQ